MTRFTYTTREINANFKIKAHGVTETGKKIHTLLGVSGLRNLIGDELSQKFVTRAFNSTTDKVTCKLRRGLEITFYVF